MIVERMTRLFGKDYAWVRGEDNRLHLVKAEPVRITVDELVLGGS